MAQDYDFWDLTHSTRLRQLGRAERQCLDLLEQAEEISDVVSAAENAQLLANIRSEAANINALHAQHVQSKIPYTPPQLSNEEKLAKDWSKCDWSDSWEWASKSKHGVDPKAFQAGMQEVMRRRQRGE
jgi:hypothetical protein